MPIAPAESLVGGPESRGDVDRVSDRLIFGRNRSGPRFLTFAILQLLAIVIASFGLLGDVPAVVIGGMIV